MEDLLPKEVIVNFQSVDNNETFQNEVGIIGNIVYKLEHDEIEEEDVLAQIRSNFSEVIITSVQDAEETSTIQKIYTQCYESGIPNEYIYTIIIKNCGPFTAYKNGDRLFIRYIDSRTGKKFEYDLDKHYVYCTFRASDYLLIFAKANRNTPVSPVRITTPVPTTNNCEVI